MYFRVSTGVLLSLVSASVLAAPSYDARTMGRGGVGLTLGEHEQALSNPALINQFDDSDDFAVQLGFGVLASDKEGLLDDLDELEGTLEDLENCTNPCLSPNPNDVADQMEEMDDKPVRLDASASLLVSIPNSVVPLALMARSTANAGVSMDYDPGDRLILFSPTFDQEDLQSEVISTAVQIDEIGIVLGQTVGRTQLGATLKKQDITLLYDVQRVGSFDPEDILDSNNTEEDSAMNVDLGVRHLLGESGRFSIAGTVDNLISHTVEGRAGVDYKLEPVATVAAGYHSTLLKAEASMELNKRAGFALVGESQFAGVGVEFSAGRHAHLRAGYRTDLNDEVEDTLTLGVGISPFDVLSLDLAAVKGEGDTYGAALQLGVKF